MSLIRGVKIRERERENHYLTFTLSAREGMDHIEKKITEKRMVVM